MLTTWISVISAKIMIKIPVMTAFQCLFFQRDLTKPAIKWNNIRSIAIQC